MERLLKQFGFSEKEIVIYKSLLKYGGDTVSGISEKTKIKRTSVQEYLRSLQQKGFVNVSKLKNKWHYQSENPGIFSSTVLERLYVVERITDTLRKEGRDERQWFVKITELDQIQKERRKIKRKKQKTVPFGSDSTGGVITENKILLFSNYDELPGLEIKSRELVEFHKKIIIS